MGFGICPRCGGYWSTIGEPVNTCVCEKDAPSPAWSPHPKQAEFMREPPSRIVMVGLPRVSQPSGCWSADAFAHDALVLCQRRVGYVIQAPEGATGLAGIDMHGTRTCGGRLIDGKCEFCDVTTIEEAR